MATITKKDPAYYVGIHHCSFRAGEPGLIKGVEYITLEEGDPQACFVVHYYGKKGVSAVDYAPISDTAHYKIISAADVINHNMPEITK